MADPAEERFDHEQVITNFFLLGLTNEELEDPKIIARKVEEFFQNKIKELKIHDAKKPNKLDSADDIVVKSQLIL